MPSNSMAAGSPQDSFRAPISGAAAATAAIGCTLVAFWSFGFLSAALIAAIMTVVWRKGSMGDVARFSLRAVLLAVPIVSSAFLVRMVWPSSLSLQAWGILYAAAVALTTAAWWAHEPGGTSAAARRMTAMDRILLGVVLGGFGGVSISLLHATIHAPAPVPNQPLANEWWPVAVGICSLAGAAFGSLIGVAIAVGFSSRRRKASLFVLSGAGAGLLAGCFGRDLSEGINLALACMYSMVCAAIAVGLAMFHKRASRPAACQEQQ